MLYTRTMAPHLHRQLWISFSIIVAGVLVAAIAFYFLTGDIAAATARIAADRALIYKQTGALGIVAQLKQEAPRAAAYQAAMDKLLPAQDGLIGFNQWLSGIAAQHQVTASASFQSNTTPPSGATPGQTGFSLSASGGINNLIAFLADTESSKPPGFLLQVTSFDLTNQGGNYQLTGQGNLFFR